MKTKEFKVGDKVFDIRYGWGEVVDVDSVEYSDTFPIVDYNNSVRRAYTAEGKEHYMDSSPILSHTEYSTQSEYPKVMEVSDCGEKWQKRVVFMEKRGMFIAWANAETFEEAEDTTGTCAWYLAREIQEPREISLQEIADKFGIPVEEVRIKK